MSFSAAKIISGILSKDIELAVSRVRRIGETGDLSSRVGLKDDTEVSYLTNEFDRLLDTLETAQEQIKSASAMQSRVEIARVVAHNIRSPLLAIEMMLPSLQNVPEKVVKVFRSSITEIKELSQQLKNEAAGSNDGISPFNLERVSLREVLTDVVAQKEAENGHSRSFAIAVDAPEGSAYWIRANRSQLKSVLSNLVNNALEAMPGRLGGVSMRLRRHENQYVLKIQDDGVGMSEKVLAKLGETALSTKEGSDRGIGIMHAKSAIEAFGGSISFSSVVGRGTTVQLSIPCDGKAS